MNANVMYAAADLGVQTIVFASSIQVMVKSSGTRGPGLFLMPYFPLDGAAPPDPGRNPYGLSKEYGERLLRVLCQTDENLSATALRFPMLPDETWLAQVAEGVPPWTLNWADGLTYLPMQEAAELVALVVERSQPGYHQYLPATTFDLEGHSLESIISEHYPKTPLHLPLNELKTLVDQSFATEFGLNLRPRVRAIISP